MKLQLTLGAQLGRTHPTLAGTDWAEFRTEFVDGPRTRRGVVGTEWWVRDGQVIDVSDGLAIAAIQRFRDPAGDRLFATVPGNTPADVDVDAALDAAREV